MRSSLAVALDLRRWRRPARTPGARLNDTVTACSWPTWLIAVGPTLRSTVAKLDSGTSAPVLLRT